MVVEKYLEGKHLQQNAHVYDHVLNKMEGGKTALQKGREDC